MPHIRIVDNIFESDSSQENGQKSQQEVKSQIIGQHEDVQFKQSDNGETVTVELPSGYKYEINNTTLNFYQQIFNDNMEKYISYEKFVPIIDRLLAVEGDVQQMHIKVDKLKEINRNFSMIEEDSDLNSIQFRIINSEEIAPDAAKRIYNAYASNELTELQSDEISILNKMINDYLLYYKYLIGVFKIYE